MTRKTSPSSRGKLQHATLFIPADEGAHRFDCYRTIAENSRDMTMWFGRDGALLWTNNAVEAYTGYSSHECIAMPDFPSSLVDAGDRCALDQAFAKALRGGEGRDIKMHFFTKTGLRVCVALDFHPIFGADGAQFGCCVIVHRLAEPDSTNIRMSAEIRRRTDSEDVLAEERTWKLSRQFFERILDALGDPVCVKDGRFRYVLVNESFVEFTGIPREDIIGRTDHDMFDGDVADMIVSGDHAVLEKRREFLIEEFMRRKDGMQRRILAKKDIYFDEHGMPFIVNVIRDITELRKEEDEIRTALAKEKELNELKSRFVSMVSHEYKTPLTAILSSAELLELFRHSWNEEKVNAHLQKIKRAVETMIEMISDALFLNKMETGRLTLNPNTFELVSFCIMIKDEIQACAPAQRQIEFSPAVTSALVTADNKFLRYIITNLLSNAVKYSFADTVIRFDVSIDGQTGVFRVQNQGIGIPADQRGRLFEPFFRAPNTGTIPGTGLGLSIVKRCVDSLQGTIAVESVENGTTTFTVTLPLRVFEEYNAMTHQGRTMHTI